MKYLFGVILLCLAVSCNYNPYSIDNDENIIVKYNKNSLQKFQSKGMISNSTIIPILDDSISFSPNLELLIDTLFNIIADKDSNKIYLFDSNFNYKGLIGKCGSGNNEFSSINSINIDPQNNIHVFSNNFTETIYSSDGKFIVQNDLSYIYSSVYGDGIDYYYYLTHINVYFNDRVLITDNNGAVIGKYFPEDYKIPVIEEQFPVFIKSPVSDAVYIRKTMTNKIYKFMSDTMFCSYTFDFGEYSIPQMYTNADDDFGGTQKQPNINFATLVRFLKGNNIAILAASVQKPEGPSIAYAINNKGEWKWLNYPFPQNLTDPLSGSLQGITVNDELIFLLSNEQIHLLAQDKTFKFSNDKLLESDSIKKCKFFILRSKLN